MLVLDMLIKGMGPCSSSLAQPGMCPSWLPSGVDSISLVPQARWDVDGSAGEGFVIVGVDASVCMLFFKAHTVCPALNFASLCCSNCATRLCWCEGIYE